MAHDLLDPLHPGPGQSRVQAGLFVALLVAGGLASMTTKAAWTAPEDKGFLSGDWTRTWEHEFDAALPFRQAGISAWGIAEWFGFRTARRGALVGDDGFLFTSEEFETLPDEAEEVSRKIDFVVDVKRRLDARGAELVVALIPAKARICKGHLGRYRLHAPERYDEVRSQLLAAGLRVPDLGATLSEGGCEASFLRTDTHWTVAGAKAAAATIAAEVRDAGLAGALPRKEFETTVSPRIERSGDLLRYLPLGPLQHLGPAPDTFAPEVTTMKAAAGGDLADALFGDAGAPAGTLVGTSYSFDPTWNFSGALQQALSAELLNVAEEGGGPFVPMIGYLTGPEIKDAPPSLVIWEIPERYLGVAYDLTFTGEKK